MKTIAQLKTLNGTDDPTIHVLACLNPGNLPPNVFAALVEKVRQTYACYPYPDPNPADLDSILTTVRVLDR